MAGTEIILLHICETQLGADHPDTAASLHNLAGLYGDMGRYGEAEPLYLRALVILTQTFPENHPHIQTAWDNFCHLIQQAVQQGQAATLSPHPTPQARLREMQDRSQRVESRISFKAPSILKTVHNLKSKNPPLPQP